MLGPVAGAWGTVGEVGVVVMWVNGIRQVVW